MKFSLPIRQSLHPPKFPSIRYVEIHKACMHIYIYDLSASGAVRLDHYLIIILLLETPFLKFLATSLLQPSSLKCKPHIQLPCKQLGEWLVTDTIFKRNIDTIKSSPALTNTINTTSA